MSITWHTDIDAQLERAEQENMPLLLDFSAAPM